MIDKISFQASDFEGNSYMSNIDCASARAAKRHFKTSNVLVGGHDLTVNDTIDWNIESAYLNGECINSQNFTLTNFNQIKAAFQSDDTVDAHLVVRLAS